MTLKYGTRAYDHRHSMALKPKMAARCLTLVGRKSGRERTLAIQHIPTKKQTKKNPGENADFRVSWIAAN